MSVLKPELVAVYNRYDKQVRQVMMVRVAQ